MDVARTRRLVDSPRLDSAVADARAVIRDNQGER